jgi:hypothetical protein
LPHLLLENSLVVETEYGVPNAECGVRHAT